MQPRTPVMRGTSVHNVQNQKMPHFRIARVEFPKSTELLGNMAFKRRQGMDLQCGWYLASSDGFCGLLGAQMFCAPKVSNGFCLGSKHMCVCVEFFRSWSVFLPLNFSKFPGPFFGTLPVFCIAVGCEALSFGVPRVCLLCTTWADVGCCSGEVFC